MTDSPQTYRSYLLRLRRQAADRPWRVSLQAVGTDQQLYFPDLESLLAYLQQPANLPSQTKIATRPHAQKRSLK